MQRLHSFLFIWTLLSVQCSSGEALDCQLNDSDPSKLAYTITVDLLGKGQFTTIQSAIDSIPDMNTQWIRILLSPGIYKEKVSINENKPCIFLEGAGRRLTSIEWGDHEQTNTSATFSTFAENFVAKGITFKNTYILAATPDNANWKQAVAATVGGDKSVFYNCAFYGVQDTFWDQQGRHYYNRCYFEGAVDFIFGAAQSIYEVRAVWKYKNTKCEFSLTIEKYAPGIRGFFTAQRKDWPEQQSGFVFKYCVFTGTGQGYLGRAWGPYSTVIIFKSNLLDVVAPEGWVAWDYVGHEANFTYVEAYNAGPGADTSKRVPWLKKFDNSQLKPFVHISFIDKEGWLAKLPSFANIF